MKLLSDDVNQTFGQLVLLLMLAYSGVALAQTDDDKAVDFISMARAAEAGDTASVAQLLKRGVKPDGYRFAPESGHLPQLAMMIVRPLQQASKKGHVEVVEALLQAGADPNWCCCDCVTALHYAIDSGHAEVAEVLIAAGADTRLPYSSKGRKYNNCTELARAKGMDDVVRMIAKAEGKAGVN